MATTVQPTTATALSTFSDQSVSTFCHVETMTDLDDGQPTLLLSSEPSHGDLQVVTADQAIAAVSAEGHRLINEGVRLALDYEAHTAPPAPTPPTWSFTDKDTGQPRTVTCLEGCTNSHDSDIETPTYPVDVYCWNTGNGSEATLPINTTGETEDYRILTTVITIDPFHDNPARNVPHAVVEVIDEHHIEDLDPDGLQAVIDTFEQRLVEMRRRHAELVRIRNEYFGRQA
ncbi:DUF6907 domain-containing protein [Streptomyces cadmiisoli]|uniref:DUF6907 domain-containing protein n=1 Tax=Streptomyces cadmiisoli TaxID=2184053 RepID=UPI0036503780